MAYRRNKRGAFGWIVIVVVVALAVVGGSAAYHNFSGTKEAVVKTAKGGKQVMSKGIDRLGQELDEYNARQKAEEKAKKKAK